MIYLNITSLQFDYAITNRIIDVGFAGGFILTDWREDLPLITSVSEQISYKTLEELNEKINYYSQSQNNQERLKIAQTFHQEISKNFTYERIIKEMLSKLFNDQEKNKWQIQLK